MQRILFVCVENSNRSQMAEAFARLHGAAAAEVASAGSRPSGQVNPRAITAMRERGYDLTTHVSKGLAEVGAGPWGYVVTMGCGDECAWVPATHREDWSLPDPRDTPPEAMNAVRDEIERRVLDLLARVRASSDAGGASSAERAPLPLPAAAAQLSPHHHGGSPLRALPVFVLSWLVAGVGAVAGSIFGNLFGRLGMLTGALLGGVLGVLASVLVLVRLGWLPAAEQRGALVGGLVAFAVAAPLAVVSLHTPITPVMSCGLVGAGVLLGAGASRSL